MHFDRKEKLRVEQLAGKLPIYYGRIEQFSRLGYMVSNFNVDEPEHLRYGHEEKGI